MTLRPDLAQHAQKQKYNKRRSLTKVESRKRSTPVAEPPQLTASRGGKVTRPSSPLQSAASCSAEGTTNTSSIAAAAALVRKSLAMKSRPRAASVGLAAAAERSQAAEMRHGSVSQNDRDPLCTRGDMHSDRGSNGSFPRLSSRQSASPVSSGEAASEGASEDGVRGLKRSRGQGGGVLDGNMTIDDWDEAEGEAEGEAEVRAEAKARAVEATARAEASTASKQPVRRATNKASRVRAHARAHVGSRSARNVHVPSDVHRHALASSPLPSLCSDRSLSLPPSQEERRLGTSIGFGMALYPTDNLDLKLLKTNIFLQVHAAASHRCFCCSHQLLTSLFT